jgi:hypothetical protein
MGKASVWGRLISLIRYFRPGPSIPTTTADEGSHSRVD